MKKTILFCTFILITVLHGSAVAQLQVSGPINQSANWNGNVTVTGDVIITGNAIITIMPGTVIKFAENNDNRFYGTPDAIVIAVENNASIQANGTLNQPITFSSDALLPQPGNWDRIALFTSSLCRFRHCTFNHAETAISVLDLSVGDPHTGGQYTQVELDTCTFSNTQSEAVYASNQADVTVRGCTFERCMRNIILDGTLKATVQYNVFNGGANGIAPLGYLNQSPQTLTVEHNTFYGINIATAGGNALEYDGYSVYASGNYYSGSTLILRNNVFFGASKAYVFNGNPAALTINESFNCYDNNHVLPPVMWESGSISPSSFTADPSLRDTVNGDFGLAHNSPCIGTGWLGFNMGHDQAAMGKAATPGISHTSTTFTDEINVSLSCSSPGVTIYYTTDGLNPTAASKQYDDLPIKITTTTTIRAIAIAAGILADSDIAEATYTKLPATPVISPASTMFTDSLSFTITCASPAANIHYSTDGNAPSGPTGIIYNHKAITIYATTTILSAAIENSLFISGIDTAVYTLVTSDTVPSPVFSPPGGVYDTVQNVTISCTDPYATIFYTDDGTDPTVSSTQYPGVAINVGTNQTLKAMAFVAGLINSPVVAMDYTINTTMDFAAAPVFNPGDTSFTSSITVKLTSGTLGAEIYYTLDGSAPNPVTGIKYGVSGFVMDTTTTVRAIAYASGFNNSNIVTATYTLINTDTDTVAAPVFSPNGGTFSGNVNVTISCDTAGAAIYYTIDGNDPDTGSYLYDSPFQVANSQTLKAFAVKDGLTNSDIATASFTIQPADSNYLPEITSTPVYLVYTGDTYRYSVIAMDGNGTDILSYALTAQPTGMTIDAGSGVIQWSPGTGDAGRHTVTVTVDDGNNGSGSQTYELEVFDRSSAEAEATTESITHLPSGSSATAYGLFSFPYVTAQDSLDKLLTAQFGTYDDTQWRAFKYVDTFIEYPFTGDNGVIPGEGYWLITRDPKTIDPVFSGLVTDSIFTSITVPGGNWKMVATPFHFPISWNDVLAATPGSDSLDQLWELDNGWKPYTSGILEPYKAYAVRNTAGAVIPLSMPAKPVALAKAGGADSFFKNWGVKVSATCDGNTDGYTYLGWSDDADAAHDANDVMEPPALPGNANVQAYFDHPDWNVAGRFTADVRPLSGNGECWDLTVQSGTVDAFTSLTWQVNDAAVPAGMAAYLYDADAAVAFNLTAYTSYEITAGRGASAKHLQMLVGTDDYITTRTQGAGGLPDEAGLWLHGAAPVQQNADIRCRLLQASHVTVTVYDAAGAPVQILLDGLHGAGTHRLHWNAAEFSSGRYVIVLRTGQVTLMRQIMVVH